MSYNDELSGDSSDEHDAEPSQSEGQRDKRQTTVRMVREVSREKR